jgi:hypothetical protein
MLVKRNLDRSSHLLSQTCELQREGRQLKCALKSLTSQQDRARTSVNRLKLSQQELEQKQERRHAWVLSTLNGLQRQLQGLALRQKAENRKKR